MEKVYVLMRIGIGVRCR